MQSDSCVYLRGVDLASLADRYLKGEFIKLVTPIPIESSLLKERPSSIITSNDKSTSVPYEFDPGYGRNFVYVGYRVSEKDGKYALLDPSLKWYCMYCLRKTSDNPMGIPIRREQRGEKIIYHMIDIFCCFECMVAELRKRNNNPLYSQSMTYISELFTLCTGKDITELKPASDQRLVKRFNGPMTWEEFHTTTIKYSEKPSNVYFLPVIEYIEQNSS